MGAKQSKDIIVDSIIPFQLTGEEALANIRENMRFVMGVSAAGKRIRVEDLQGIYVPAWDYDVQCHVSADIKKISSSAFAGVTICHRKAECRFLHVLQNASGLLSDETVGRLEPYNMKEAVAFEESFIDNYNIVSLDALQRASEEKVSKYLDDILTEELIWSEGDLNTNSNTAENVVTQYFWNGAPRLTLLPVWVLKLSYNKKVYSIMVNGQTGKVIGTIPVFGWVYAYQTLKYGLIFSAGFCLLLFFLYDLSGGLPAALTISLLICAPLFVISGIRNIRKKNRFLKNLPTTEALHFGDEGEKEIV